MYELYYKLDKSTSDVIVDYPSDTIDLPTGLITKNEQKEIIIRVRNNSLESVNITFGVLGGLINNSLILTEGNKIDEYDNSCQYTQGQEFIFNYIGNSQEFSSLCNGNYKVELWGAGGGTNDRITGGAGSYVSGNIYLTNSDKLYVYVGEGGIVSDTQNVYVNSTYNGGGSGSSNPGGLLGSGGGATDVRLVSGNWNSYESLKSRIIVAAGGGTGVDYFTYSVSPNGTDGASGGGLLGYEGIVFNSRNDKFVYHDNSGGGTQTTGGAGGSRNFGFFGYAGITRGSCSGGGSGYFGGAGGDDFGYSPSGGGSGSSFISGHNGCVAILEESTEDNIIQRLDSNGNICADGTIDITCSYHYSGMYFTDTVMIDGTGYNWTTEKGDTVVGMPTHDGTSTMIGNSGNGYAKITYLGK